MNTKPLLKDLYIYVTPRYAADWIVIGTLLNIPDPTLRIIELNHMYRAAPCCNEMLRRWLQMDLTASWGTLFNIIESPAVSCSAPDEGD